MTVTDLMNRRHGIRRSAADRRPRKLARWRFGSAILAVVSLAAIGAIGTPAYAADYPSWQDVQNAKANQAAVSAQVTNIQNLISQLTVQVQQTQAEAVKRGAEFRLAQQKFDEADLRAKDLQQQADASQAEADEATTQAGRLAAQFYRTGGANLTMNLFLSGGQGRGGQGQGKGSAGGPDRLLAHLGSMSKLVEHTSEIYEKAATAENTAKSLSAQADVARTEREKLRVAAHTAMEKAAAAAKAAQAKLKLQQSQIVILQAQLAALQDTTAKTVASYQEGVAARAAAAGASGAGAGLPGGYIGPQGWGIPVHAVITDGYGPRDSPCSGCSSWHMGIDLGTSCGSPIYAAHDGTVIYAGPNGSYGNFILIDHGGGISTGYGHIRPGGIFVGVGQQVGVGENIARVGSTGASTGCHLHFEVRVNGSAIDGIPFMSDRGAPLG